MSRTPPPTVQRLILVYDAPSGTLAAIADSARKLFGRGCALCRITHGPFGERPAWRAYRRSLGAPVEAIYRDEIDGRHRAATEDRLPAVLALVEEEPLLLVGSEALEACRGQLEPLGRAIEAAMGKQGLRWSNLTV